MKPPDASGSKQNCSTGLRIEGIAPADHNFSAVSMHCCSCLATGIMPDFVFTSPPLSKNPMTETFQFADVSIVQLALVCVIALFSSILGGLAGYGTGLVLPAFIAPIVGVANVIPVLAVGMLFNNGSRVMAFLRDIQWPHVRNILLFGLPACIAGAYGYTLLNGRTIALLLGSFLIISVPLRRILHRADKHLSTNGLRGAAVVFGFLNGGMPGAGILLISALMAAGVQGAALIGTDAIISFILGVAKVVLFGSLSKLDINLALAGILIGLCTAPGAFVARWLLKHIPARIHTWVMELVVACSGMALLWRGLQ